MTSNAAAIELSAHGGWADWAGMVASIGCAIHCAAMPLVLAYLPTLGLDWLASEGFHRWMAVVCFGLAATAFVPGWLKHRSFVPAVWGGLGLFALTIAAFGLEDGCCASCPSEERLAVTTECDICCELSGLEDTPTSAPGVASVTPFITPLGGLLLVVGHIVNHLKSCECRGETCCLPSKDSSQA